MKKIYVHLVSDSTGETLSVVSKTILAQFEQVDARQYLWAFVNTSNQLKNTISVIKKRPGIIMHTITKEEHKKELEEEGKKMGVPCIEVLKDPVGTISEYLGEKAVPGPGKQHAIDKEYFKRIEALNFALTHDDGQQASQLKKADIILIGPSRTSKSPTSIYLAYRGFKTANIPYVSGVAFPVEISKFKEAFVVGLTISADRLVEIRKSRLLTINEHKNTSYIDVEDIGRETLGARRLCTKNEWPIIDITNKSVEETSARIIQMYHKWRKKKL